jgi:hypothetical protein
MSVRADLKPFCNVTPVRFTLSSARRLRQWLDLCSHMHPPFVFPRFTLKSLSALNRPSVLALSRTSRPSARLAMKLRAPPPQYVLPKCRRRQRVHPACRSAASPAPR